MNRIQLMILGSGLAAALSFANSASMQQRAGPTTTGGATIQQHAGPTVLTPASGTQQQSRPPLNGDPGEEAANQKQKALT